MTNRSSFGGSAAYLSEARATYGCEGSESNVVHWNAPEWPADRKKNAGSETGVLNPAILLRRPVQT
jgi:hypothetical protein